MVKSETNDPDALLAALKAGDYYSSSGPEIYDLVVEPGERLRLRCSPADRIFLIGGPAKYETIGEQGITEAEFDLSAWTSPLRARPRPGRCRAQSLDQSDLVLSCQQLG